MELHIYNSHREPAAAQTALCQCAVFQNHPQVLAAIRVGICFILMLVCGNSKIISDWKVKKASLKVSLLDHSCARVMELQSTFYALSFKHIDRNFNVVADSLFKKAVDDVEGLLYYEEYIDLYVHSRGTIKVF